MTFVGSQNNVLGEKNILLGAHADSLPWRSGDLIDETDPRQPSGGTPAGAGRKEENFQRNPPPPYSVKTKTASIQPNKIRYITNSVSNNLFHIMHFKKKTTTKYKIDSPPPSLPGFP